MEILWLWLVHTLYIAGISVILNVDFIQTRIFKYNEEDNEYLHVFDRSRLKETIHDRHTRSTTQDNKKTSSKPTISPNISSYHIFKEDSNNVAFVFWKHAETTVIFILTCQSANTTNYNKHSNKGCKSKSRFYRSADYGKSFQPITQVIENAHLHSIYLSPINKKFIALTDYKNQSLYLTNDEGKTFKRHKVPFKPTYIYFHPVREHYIAAYDNTINGENSLFLSEDRGINWVRVSKKVRNYFWAREGYDDDNRIMYIEKQSDKKIDSKTVSSFLYMSRPPYYSNGTRLLFNQHLVPYSVYVGEKFIITQRMHDRKLYVSAGSKKTFAMATFDKQSKPHVMHVVISDENSEILLALVHPLFQASLYLSDSSGQHFRLRQSNILTEAIKNHVVPPKMDLYVVKGVFGTYIVNKRGMGSSITFDKGHTWKDIKVDNKHAKGGQLNPRGGKKCDLILYLKIEHPFSDFTAPIISKTNAPGIIIAQGLIGKYRPLAIKHDVFISIDGGYTWKHKLETTHGYVILDHGGLIAATPLKYTQANAQVTYTKDYGKNWSLIHLTKLYSRIAAIITESTASLLVMNVFGFLHPDKRGGSSGNTWIVWQFNFSKVLNRTCKEQDYSTWHHNKRACVMGEKSSSKRRDYLKQCINGPNFNNNIVKVPCSCTYEDFSCEQDFYRRYNKNKNQSECIPINPKHTPIKICEKGDYYIKSKGYKKLYGNKCKGGVENKVSPTIERCKVMKPGWVKIKASSTLVAVNEIVKFYINQVDGFYNATYVWEFNDQNKNVKGSYLQVKEVTHKFEKLGKYNVTLSASNTAGFSKANITVNVIDNSHLNAHIMYDHPLIINMPKQFSLKTFGPNGTLIMVDRLPSTKIMWSFDGVYSGDDNSIVTEYTFVKSGVVNVEVQVINAVSEEVYRERVSVYQSAVVVDISFSPKLDKLNAETETWIIDFETKYKHYLDNKYDLEKDDISDRVLVRGSAAVPTKLSIIFYDTKKTVNTLVSAYNIAEKISKDINKNKPFVKGYESVGVRVLRAKIIRPSKVHGEKPRNKYIWVYVVIVMVIMAVIMSLMGYYQYRRKGSLWCIYKRDSMNKQLIDMDDEAVDEVETPENYNNL